MNMYNCQNQKAIKENVPGKEILKKIENKLDVEKEQMSDDL